MSLPDRDAHDVCDRVLGLLGDRGRVIALTARGGEGKQEHRGSNPPGTFAHRTTHLGNRRVSARNYWAIITRRASFSRSRYWAFSTVTPAKSILPPLNVPGVLYSWLTASPLS